MIITMGSSYLPSISSIGISFGLKVTVQNDPKKIKQTNTGLDTPEIHRRAKSITATTNVRASSKTVSNLSTECRPKQRFLSWRSLAYEWTKGWAVDSYLLYWGWYTLRIANIQNNAELAHGRFHRITTSKKETNEQCHLPTLWREKPEGGLRTRRAKALRTVSK